MQFAPKELRVKAGDPVRIVFENPDLMQHNFVLVGRCRGRGGNVSGPNGGETRWLCKEFHSCIREDTLAATPLVNPNGK